MLTLGWLVLLGGSLAVEVAPMPAELPAGVAVGGAAIAALLIMLLLPEPRPVSKTRHTTVTFADQRINLASGVRVAATANSHSPKPDDAYRSHESPLRTAA